MLADYLSDAFPHIKDKNLLSWAYRKPLLFQELQQLNADVICMEEVDHFDDFRTHLTQYGYEGIFKKKVGSNLDGCALFWKPSKYVPDKNQIHNRLGLKKLNITKSIIKLLKSLLLPNLN